MHFGILQCMQHVVHKLTSTTVLCVTFILAEGKNVDVVIACDGFPYAMEIVHIFHSGFFDYRSTF